MQSYKIALFTLFLLSVEGQMSGQTYVLTEGDPFIDDLTGWGVGTSHCGPYGWLVGGYGVMAGGSFSKTYMLPSAGCEVRVQMKYIQIDTWDGERAAVKIGDYTWENTLHCCGNTGNKCGRIEGEVDHDIDVTQTISGVELTIEALSQLDQHAGDESFGITDIVITVNSCPEMTPCTLAETTFTIDETINGNSGAMTYFAIVNVPGPHYVFRQNPGTCSYKELTFGIHQNDKTLFVGMCGVGTSITAAALPDGVNAIAMKYHAYGELEIWANGAKLDLLHSQINGRAFSSSSTFQSACSDQIKVYNRALSQNELETMTALTPGCVTTKKYTRHVGMIRAAHAKLFLSDDDLIPTDPVCVVNDDWTPPFCRAGKYPQGLAIGIDRCKIACDARPKCKSIGISHPTRGTSAECFLGVETNDQDHPLMAYGHWDWYDIEESCETGPILKECRWETNHDQNPNSADYMGWTCANDEILTGFGLSADQHDVTKVQCCKVGGHSSIKPNTCTYVESNHERAKCGNGNDHMVFSGAYDKRAAANDAVTEILAGKCCEVECDADWCAGKDWGVDKNNCQVISTAGNSAQELVCPTGTLMTEIEDGLAGNAHGVQKVASVTCCAFDVIAPPTQAPSPAPTTARPTSAPTRAPSTMPSIAPTTVDDCLLALKDSSQLTDSQYLSSIDQCLPGCRSNPQRRALENRLLSENNRRQ